MVLSVSGLLFIVTWTWLLCLFILYVLAVRYLAQEHSTVDLCVEVFLIINSDDLIMARCWIFLSRQVVFSSLIWLEHLSGNLASDEVSSSLSFLNMVFLETVASWANCVLAKS